MNPHERWMRLVVTVIMAHHGPLAGAQCSKKPSAPMFSRVRPPRWQLPGWQPPGSERNFWEFLLVFFNPRFNIEMLVKKLVKNHLYFDCLYMFIPLMENLGMDNYCFTNIMENRYVWRLRGKSSINGICSLAVFHCHSVFLIYVELVFTSHGKFSNELRVDWGCTTVKSKVAA